MSLEEKSTNEPEIKTHEIELTTKSKVSASATVERIYTTRKLIIDIFSSVVVVAALSLFSDILFKLLSYYLGDRFIDDHDNFGRILSYTRLITIVLTICIGTISIFVAALRLYRRSALLKEQAVKKLRSKEEALFHKIDSDVNSLLKESHQYGQ